MLLLHADFHPIMRVVDIGAHMGRPLLVSVGVFLI